MPSDDRILAFTRALLANDRGEARRLYFDKDGATAAEELLTPSLDRIGRAWEEGEVALSQVYFAGKICEELFQAAPAGPGPRRGPRIAVAVFEDHHMLGKRMVLSQLRVEGLEPADWGRMDAATLLSRLEEEPRDYLLLSCLMLHSALRIGALRERLRGDFPGLRLVVGGAPFRLDPLLWKEVGADAGGGPASEAGLLIRRLEEGGR